MESNVLSRGVSIDRLLTFCRVVEKGSITAAAGGDPNRQSLYSRQIRQLEEALEKRLFIRNGKSLRLSDDGRRLAVMTNAYFSALNEFARGESSLTVRIGAGESALEAFVYPRFKELRSTLPKVRFEFVNLTTREIIKELAAGGIEFGLLRENAGIENCETRFVGSLEFDLVAPRSLLRKGNLEEIRRLKELPTAILSGKGSFVRSLLSLAREEQWPLVPVARADSFTKLSALARNGDLAVVLPKELSGKFPESRFTRCCLSAFKQLTRRLTLAVSREAKTIRPALGRYFDVISTLLITRAPELSGTAEKEVALSSRKKLSKRTSTKPATR